MATWTVTRDENKDWQIREDGMLVETVLGHYDAWDALNEAERHILHHGTCWRLTDTGGFWTEVLLLLTR